MNLNYGGPVQLLLALMPLFTNATEEGGWWNSLFNLEGGIVEFFTEGGKSLGSGLLIGLIEGMSGEEASGPLITMGEKIVEFIINVGMMSIWPSRSKEFADKAYASYMEFVVAAVEWANIGEGIVNGIAQGLDTTWEGLKSTAAGMVDGLMGTLKGALHIESPSKKAAREIGGPLAEGIGVGFEESIAAFKAKAGKMVVDAMPNLGQLVGSTKQYYNSINLRQTNHLPAGTLHGDAKRI